MSHWTLRVLAYLALASLPFANGAQAGVGDSSGSAGSWLGHLSPVQTIQFNSFGSNCYYADGWNGRGWYQCGDDWNNGFGWVGPFNTSGALAFRRNHRHGVVVLHPRAPNAVYPGLESSRLLGVGVPSARLRVGAPAFGGGPRFRQFGAGGVHSLSGIHARAATVPGFAGGGFHSGLGGGNFHQFHGAGVPHIGAPISPGFAGGGGYHGFGGAGNFHGAGVG